MTLLISGASKCSGAIAGRLSRQLISLASCARWLPGCGPAACAVGTLNRSFFTSAMDAGPLNGLLLSSMITFLRRPLFLPWELPNLLSPDMAAEGLKALARCRALAATIVGLTSRGAPVSALEMERHMRGQLPRNADGSGLARSIGIGMPSVDACHLRIVAPVVLGTQPPGKMEMAATSSRWLLEVVLNQPRIGFAVPVRERVHEGTELRRDRRLRGWGRRVYEGLVSR